MNNLLESDFLSKKRIVIFGINRIQSDPTLGHIKEIHNLYDKFDVDEVCCVAFCDFVMFEFLTPKLSNRIKFFHYTDNQTLEKFKELLNKKGNYNYLKEYWQFACVLNDGLVEHYIEQPLEGKVTADTKKNIYSNVSAEKLLKLMRT